jgi:hypothetical protein
MNFVKSMNSFSPIEIILLIGFVLYLVFPVENPSILNGIIDSSLGMVIIFTVTILLFVYMNPMIAVLYIFVAYELLRRSGKVASMVVPEYVNYNNIPQLTHNDVEVRQDNVNTSKENILQLRDTSLEEDVVRRMAPIGISDTSTYIPSGFKPTMDSTISSAAF